MGRVQGPASYLLQHQLPINSHGGPAILLTVLPQPAAHLPHPLQTVPAVQQVLDIFGHDFSDILELIVQFVQVRGGPGVLVGFLGALDEGVELDEGIRSNSCRQVLL